MGRGATARSTRALSNHSESPASVPLSALLTIPEKRTLSSTASPTAVESLTTKTISVSLKNTSGASRSIDISVCPDFALILETHPYQPSTFLVMISSLYSSHRGAIRAKGITVGMGVGVGAAIVPELLHCATQNSMPHKTRPRHPIAAFPFLALSVTFATGGTAVAELVPLICRGTATAAIASGSGPAAPSPGSSSRSLST